MVNVNRYRLGFFVIGGFVLLLGALFYLGMKDKFKPRGHFFTMFDESVQGLELGAAVKYKGVTIGQVEYLTICPNNQIRVGLNIIMENVDTGFSEDKNAKQRLKAFEEYVHSEIPKGLRCQLNPQGITGMKYVEISHFGKPQKPGQLPLYMRKEKDAFIPSQKSFLTDTMHNLDRNLENLSKVDMQGISDRVKETLDTFKKLAERKDIKEMVAAVKRTVEQVERSVVQLEKTLAKSKIDRAFTKANETLNEIQKLSKDLSKMIKSAEVEETSKSIRQTLKSSSDAADNFAALAPDIRAQMIRMNETLERFANLAEQLEQDPSSIIYGKQQDSEKQ